jgi:hypothetical protein
MTSRRDLMPKDVRRLVARLRLPGPPLYAGTLNGEPNGYRAVRVPSAPSQSPARDAPNGSTVARTS